LLNACFWLRKDRTMEGFVFYDLQGKVRSDSIDLLFPGWRGDDEVVAVLSPHDDDAILGAGYLILAAQSFGAEVYVLIFCDGRAGYSFPEERETIVERRRRETVEAYSVLGIPQERVVRFDRPDFSLIPYIGWLLPDGSVGVFEKHLKTLRQIKVTRMVIPNGYREHIDHEACSRIGAYDGPQVGDPVLADWGMADPVLSYLIYSVWGDFSPEDAVISGRSPGLRANRAVGAPFEVEDRVISAIKSWGSQAKIIENLVKSRAGRRMKDRVIEVYLEIDPRPPLDYTPYRRAIEDIG